METRTAPTIFPHNHAVMIGMLRQRTSERQRVTPMGATIDDMTLELLTPFGIPFGVHLKLAGVITGMQYLWQTGSSQTRPLVVEGYVRIERSHDARFAHADAARGRLTRAMEFVVRQVRPAAEGDPLGESAVWLEGVVQRPPVFVRHPTLPEVRLALTELQITLERPSSLLGSAVTHPERHDVTVTVPTTHPQAGLLYQPGNHVRLQGQIDCVMVDLTRLRRRTGVGAELLTDDEAALDPALQVIHDRYQEALRRLDRQASVAAQEQLYADYLQKLRRLADTPRWRVLAGNIEPANDNAVPISQSKATRLRAARSRTVTPTTTRPSSRSFPHNSMLVHDPDLRFADTPLVDGTPGQPEVSGSAVISASLETERPQDGALAMLPLMPRRRSRRAVQMPIAQPGEQIAGSTPDEKVSDDFGLSADEEQPPAVVEELPENDTSVFGRPEDDTADQH